MIASGTSGGGIHLIDATTGRELGKAQGHSDEVRSVSFSPDGRYLATSGAEAIIWNSPHEF